MIKWWLVEPQTVYNGSEHQKGLQEEFYRTQFLPYLHQKAKDDGQFPSKFVQWCTGSCFLQYVIANGASVKIKVEFDHGADQLYVTCNLSASCCFVAIQRCNSLCSFISSHIHLRAYPRVWTVSAMILSNLNIGEEHLKTNHNPTCIILYYQCINTLLFPGI